jgi:hypothetical protein
MRRMTRWIWAVACVLAACSSRNDTTGTDLTSGTSGAGGSGTGTGGGCPANYTPCSGLCCAPGKVCTSPGRCDYPYETADLYVYLCPSFNTGNCKASYFSIDQTCTPLRNPTPGTCYNTGFKVAGGQSYGISSCTGCAMGCGNPASLTTPAGFTKPNYYSGMSFYCGTPCTPPPECSQAANAGGPSTTSTGSTSAAGTGGGSGSGAGAGGAGGSFGTTGTGGAGDICTKSGSTKQCSQMISCSKCSFQSCTCYDGSNCSAGYHTSDGLDFPCASCPNGCTEAAQAVVAHCGCAP